MSRLYLALVMEIHKGAKFVIQAPTAGWLIELMNIAGVELKDCIRVGEEDRVRVEELCVPTITGIGGVLNRSVSEYTFAKMKFSVLRKSDIYKTYHRTNIIWPLHTPMTSRGFAHSRMLDKREELVQSLRARFGIDVFDPTKLSLSEQIKKFQGACLVIGEDSSALHNVLWSKSADLLVMAPKGALNYYHIGIQAINGGRTAIIWGDIVDANERLFRIKEDFVSNYIDKLLSERD
jgi:hypothetical protein